MDELETDLALAMTKLAEIARKNSIKLETQVAAKELNSAILEAQEITQVAPTVAVHIAAKDP